MRDLTSYVEAYKDHGFEAIQAAFRRRTVLAFLREHKARRILEVGTGLSPLFLDYTDFDLFTVVEPAEGFFQEVVKLAGDTPNLNLIQATLEEAADELKGVHFDAVVMSSLLHEVPHPAALLLAAHGLMGPDTVLHVNVPNANSFHRLLALEAGLIKSILELSPTQIKLQQHGVFTEASLKDLLEDADFDVLHTGTLFVKPFTHGQMIQLMESGILTEAMLEGLNNMVKHLPGLGSELYLSARKRVST